MLDPEVRRFIRQEIARHMNVILAGNSGTNTVETESIFDMFPGMPEIEKRPVMHPYGFASRAPNKTIQVTGRHGEHVGNRIVLGHRDSKRPEVKQGECILYNQFGQAVYLEDGKIHIGKKESVNPVVLGIELKALLQDLITRIANHVHITTVPGSQTTVPVDQLDFLLDQQNNVDNDKIFSDYIFVEKSP